MKPVQPIRIKQGFVEIIDSDTIATLTFFFNGRCIIQYADGTCSTIHTEADVYNCQYGIPITEDGKVLFISSWEKGLSAVSTETGELKWRYRSTRITSIYAYPNHVIATRYGHGLLKLDRETGALLEQFKSSTLEFSYWLNDRFLLLNKGCGNLCIVDTDSMQMVKKYKQKVVNPNDCLSLLIQRVYTNGGELHICGIESHPHKQSADTSESRFDRKIDDNYKSF